MRTSSLVAALTTRHFPAFISVLSLLLAAITLSCSPGASTQTSSGPTTSVATSNTSASSQYQITVTLNDKQIASLTVADLTKLPQIRANIGGTEEQGPTLASVLDLAGVKDFSEVTIYGFTKGRLASAELTLQKAQVTDNVMLALVTRGTAKLTGTDIGAQKAIIDVNKIVVK